MHQLAGNKDNRYYHWNKWGNEATTSVDAVKWVKLTSVQRKFTVMFSCPNSVVCQFQIMDL